MFQRKKIESASDRRSAYRRTQTQAHRLTISVRSGKGAEIPGSFHDLSVGGASALFPGTGMTLAKGQQVILTIGSLTHAAKVVATARVAFAMEAKGGRLCGFQFTDPMALTPQIDEFYARFFNRRKTLRVGMPLDKRVQVHLGHAGAELKSEMVDISIDGMKVRLPSTLAKQLDGANHATLRFTLPGHKDPITGSAAILRRTPSATSTLLGLAFELESKDGISKHRPAIGEWVVHRTNEIAKWDSSLTKPEAAA